MCQFIEEAVLKYGISQSEKIAIYDKIGATSYGELRTDVCRAKMKLEMLGIKAGDRIMLSAIAQEQYIACYLAIHILGAIAIPVDKKATEDTIQGMYHILEVCLYLYDKKKEYGKCNCYSYENIFSDQYENNEIKYTKPNIEAIYDILFTTGTTGKSKGVIQTYKSVISAVQNEIEGADMNEKDILLIPIPLNHSFGISKMRTILYLGGTIVLQNNIAVASELSNNIKEYHCTCLVCVPSALEVIYRQAKSRIGEVLGKLRFIEVASAPFGIEMKKILMLYLPKVHILNRFGSTETPASIYLDLLETPDKIASIGKALPNVQVKIVDNQENIICSSKENVGRLAISGTMIMQGYWNEEELTKSVMHDGWMYTNDLAYIDANGYIFLMGRADDVINSGGKKISPIEVEEVVMQFKGIKECACIGVKDIEGILGDIPILFYTTIKGDIDIYDLEIFLKTKIEKYKIPVKYIKIEKLPRNYMGKLERSKLKEYFF